MIAKIRSFAASLVRESDLSLQLRIFRLMCLTTTAICLAVIPVVNWWQRLPIWVNVGDIVLGFIALFCLRESMRGRHRAIGFFVMLVALLDGIWFFNAGSAGSVTFYFFPAALYPIVVFRGRIRRTMTLLLAANVCGLLLAEYFFPHWVTPFRGPEDRLIDLLSGVLCSGLALVLVLGLVVKTYDYEHERLQGLAGDLANNEQRLRLALEASNQSWFEIDLVAQVVVVGANPARVGHPAAIFRMPIDEWRERVHPQDRELAFCEFDSLAAAGVGARLEHRVRNDTGEWRWVRILARGMDPGETGKPKRIIGTVTDITHLKKLEAELQYSQRLESVGILAGGVAHHINNLLTPIVIGSDMMRMKSTRPEEKAMIAQMADSAKRASVIVRELVTFSQVKGQFRVPIETLAMVREVIRELRARMPPAIRLVDRLAEDLWTVTVDPVQVQRALLNICINACEAMPQGGTLTIEAANLELPSQSETSDSTAKGERFVTISVADTGRGISAENLPRIFDPFFTTKELGHGPGLGLSTAYGVMTAHGGSITVSSDEGQGATFRIQIPS